MRFLLGPHTLTLNVLYGRVFFPVILKLHAKTLSNMLDAVKTGRDCALLWCRLPKLLGIPGCLVGAQKGGGG